MSALISFSLCSGLLLAVYHLLLKGKTLYRFNRYYLLFSLAFSLSVPFVAIKTTVPVIDALKPVEENITILPADGLQHPANPATMPVNHATPVAPIVHESVNYWPYVGWWIYSLVSLSLLLRFCRNLYLVGRTIKTGERLVYNNAELVLSDKTNTPYTFLGSIFLNRDDYHNQNIDPAILKHELSHAAELHSVDIILIELLQAICWFNLFIPFYRKAIELNHEFIADAAAIDHTADISGYQYLLLNTVSRSSGLSIASQFNYLTIKKRLIMMNRSTTSAKAIVAKIATVPMFAVAFLLFCTKADALTMPSIAKVIKSIKPVKIINTTTRKDTIAKKHKFPPPILFSKFPYTNEGVSEAQLKDYQQIVGKYMTADSVFQPHMKVTNDDREKLEAIYRKMNREQQGRQWVGFYTPGPPQPAHRPSQTELDLWKDPNYCGLWLNDKKVSNSVLNNYKPSDFGQALSSKLYGAAKKNKTYRYQVNIYTVDVYSKMRQQQVDDQNKSFIYFRMKPKHH